MRSAPIQGPGAAKNVFLIGVGFVAGFLDEPAELAAGNIVGPKVELLRIPHAVPGCLDGEVLLPKTILGAEKFYLFLRAFECCPS